MTTHATAKLRYLHIAPRKTRAAVDVIRGLSVPEAEAQLLLMPRRAATPLLKLLRSAAANAKQAMKKDADALFIKEIRVDQGPKSTRWMPRARGAMSPIERKTSHVSIVLGVVIAPKASRFTIKGPEKKKIKVKSETHDHDRPSRSQSDRGSSMKSGHEEKKETEKKAEKKGFAQRFFRRKAV